MKKFIFIFLLTITPIIKPIHILEILFYKTKTDQFAQLEHQWNFKVDECSIENYTKLLNQILQQRRIFNSDKKFIFFIHTSAFRNCNEEKSLNTDKELQDYAKSNFASYLTIKAVEMTEEEQKQEQEERKKEQELTTAADKIEQQFGNYKSNCIIQ